MKSRRSLFFINFLLNVILSKFHEFVPVSESEKRFGIETQANDLLDDLL